LNFNTIENDLKFFLLDTGLLISCYGKQAQQELINKKLGSHKGAIYENVIANILAAKGYELLFFQRNKIIRWYREVLVDVGK
jgi:predicted AAA+ superfamily ATPase